MSVHVRKQLRDGVVGALVGSLTGVADRVFPGRTWPLTADADFPAVLVFTPGGPSGYDTMGWRSETGFPALDRQERVAAELRVRTKGVEPDDALDALALEVERLVIQWAAGSALLQTLELVQTQVETRAAGDAREGVALLTWQAGIRTPADAPDMAL